MNNKSKVLNIVTHTVEGSMFHLYMCRNVFTVVECKWVVSNVSMILYMANLEGKMINLCRNRKPSTFSYLEICVLGY